MQQFSPELSGNHPRGQHPWAAPLKVAVIYVLVAGGWIVLSDRVLFALFPDAEQLTWLQTVKGVFFVVASALMLAGLVRHYVAALQTEVHACQRIQESFRALVETIPHGVQECDSRGVITFTNSGYDRIFGYVPGEAVGKAIWDNNVIDEERQAAKVYFEALVRNQPEPTPYLTRNTTKDGRIVDLQVDWNYLRDEQGRLIGFASIVTDITERLRAEESIRTSDRLKTDLIRTAAHEFRTPLTTIIGFSELLLDLEDVSDAERRDYIENIHRKSLSLSGMVDSLLDLSRIEAGLPLPMKLATCSVEAMAREATPYLKSLASSHTVEVDLEAKSILVQADRARIAQVLENLLSNAAKYSPKGSVIRLLGRPEQQGYRLAVRDEGVGMSPEQVARIFENFYRADTSDTGPSGLGVGMAIVKVIVEAHGSQVVIDSARGEGTTVSFLLSYPL